MNKPFSRQTFVIQILNNQNSSWQGSITWTEGKRTETFRSALELFRLMDSAMTEEAAAQLELSKEA